MAFLYNLAIYGYYFLILIASLFNKKARQWIAGRKNLFNHIKTAIGKEQNIVWFHSASLGEFEQGRPVIESFREKFPKYKILLTFFSPSGFEIRKNYTSADYIFYLPIDTRKNANKFIKIIKPKLAFFIKYDFWYNYINALSKANIPIFFISAIFRKEQYFFKWYGVWFRKNLNKISYFFVQNNESENLLNSIGIKNVLVSGDTRFDRVFALAQQKKPFPSIEQFKQNSEVFLAGSTWPPDEELILDLIKNNLHDLKFIIAPHETHKERIDSLIKNINAKVLKYSEATDKNINEADILIIDSVGILAHLYQYATIAYIGGGFGVDIHNIQEPVTFGKPVIFGPKYHKFQEARDLVKLGGAFSISSINDLIKITNKLLKNRSYYLECSEICKNYILEKTGATE
ncbi:MAG: 3-deoxy-D-manno-octulosonic acid transferase, partial [Bacteroidales bacterium]|nr:3-deoxy-D-manno-octulosonic acid transferase [Bacteroidales bacterium]